MKQASPRVQETVIAGEAVQFRVADRIAWVTLDRPAKKNAIDRPMRRELQSAYLRIKHDPEIWTAILTGNGDVFCAGKDLLEPAVAEDGSVLNNDELYLLQRHIYKPFILALNGPCLAQGGGFALNADIIIMAEEASLGWPQVRRGISTVSGPTLAPHALPWPLAMGYLMRGKPIPAPECLRFGIANEVVPRGEILAVAERWARGDLRSGTARGPRREGSGAARHRYVVRGPRANRARDRESRSPQRGFEGRYPRLSREAQAGLAGAMTPRPTPGSAGRAAAAGRSMR